MRIAVALVMLVLTGGIIGTAIGMVRADRGARQAQQARDEALHRL